jgi:hypothetical protein
VLDENHVPVILGHDSISTQKNTSLELEINDLRVWDEDNTFPDDFALYVEEGDNYTHSGTTITPKYNFLGYLAVPVKVSDGINLSEPFEMSVAVKEFTNIYETGSSNNGIVQKIYPNPAQDFVIIELNERPYDVNCLLFDITGKIVENALIVKGKNEFRIYTSDILPGVLFFKIYNNEYNEIQKIVISR